MADKGVRGWLSGALGRVDQRVRRAAPAMRLARQSGSTLRAWLRYRAAVEASVGAELAEAYTALILDVSDKDADLARSVAVSLPDHLVRVRPEHRAAYLKQLGEVLRVRIEALPLLVRTLPDLVSGLEGDALRGFVAQGLALYGEAPQKAESFLRRESGTGQAAVSALRKGVGLSEVQRTLSLYARAHCGEDVQVRAGNGRSFSDGHHIYLPERVDQFGDDRDFLVYRVQTALSAGYLEFGTFDLDLSRVPGPWPDRREGEAEVERFLRGFSNRSLARDLYQVLEDARVERRIRTAYPGIARDLDRLGVAFRGDRPVPKAPAARAVEAFARRSWGLEGLPVEPREAAAIAPLIVALADVQSANDVALAVVAGFPAVEALMRHVDQPSPDLGLPDDAPPPRRKPRKGEPGKPEQAEAGGYPGLEQPPLQPRIRPEAAGPDERKVEEEARRLLEQMRAQGKPGERSDARRQARDEKEREAMLDMAAHLGGAVTERGEAEDKAAVAATGLTADPDVERVGKAHVYKEWDATIEDYKPRWAVVREHILAEGSRAFVDQTMGRHKFAIAQLRRRFEALRPQGLIRIRDLPDGDDLDIDRVVEAHIDRRIGMEPRDRLYIKRHREQRDVAVAFLVDLSSSTNESADGTSRRIIDVEKEALVVAAEALHALGDPFAIWGFSGYGREHVNFYVAKDFHDAWDDRARQRIGRMSFKMENRDGAAIRHATARLAAMPARVRLLLLLSDGKPLDCGCDHYFDRYAQEDTRVALREARQAGVHPFCITVDPTGPQYLARMYGEVAYTVIDRVEALPARLVKVYRRLAL